MKVVDTLMMAITTLNVRLQVQKSMVSCTLVHEGHAQPTTKVCQRVNCWPSRILAKSRDSMPWHRCGCDGINQAAGDRPMAC